MNEFIDMMLYSILDRGMNESVHIISLQWQRKEIYHVQYALIYEHDIASKERSMTT